MALDYDHRPNQAKAAFSITMKSKMKDKQASI